MNSLKTFRSGNRAGAGDETAWGYDPATGLQTSKTYADGSSDGYHYDALLRPDGLTRPGQTADGLAYNGAGELTGVAYHDPGHGGDLAWAARVDDKGRATVTTETGAGGPATRVVAYTPQDQVRVDRSGGTGAGVEYAYYGPAEAAGGASPGALKSMKVTQGGAVLSETGYAYDPATKRLQTVTVKDGAGAVVRTFTYAYKPNTDLIASITTGGVTTAYGYEYETSGAPATTRLRTVGTTGAYSASYAYTATDQRADETVARTLPGGTPGGYGVHYAYDDRDELTGVSSTGGSGGPADGSWRYDGAGNRVDPATGGAHPTLGAANSLNQYANFGYDGRGNTTDDGAFTYTYDALDRLTSATAKAGGGKEEYAYNPAGRLVEVRRFSNGGLTGSTRFAYAGDQLVAEFDGATNRKMLVLLLSFQNA